LNSAGVRRRINAAGDWELVSGGCSTGCGALSRAVIRSVEVKPVPL
jgi:hypothetical protein